MGGWIIGDRLPIDLKMDDGWVMDLHSSLEKKNTIYLDEMKSDDGMGGDRLPEMVNTKIQNL